jgi:orotidine-5'-phosphate decarboxylase
LAETPALIVALDLPALADAAALVQRLRSITPWFKIGSMLFTRAGPEAVRMVHAAGGQVFLDLKFHDIPQTIAGGVAAAANLGVALLTVHCAAGPAALAAALAARPAGSELKLLGVTRLTSDAGRVGPSVVRAARIARDAGLDGVTASVRECARIKAACGADFRVLTPGIRPAGAMPHDQARVATPRQAVRAGADYLVCGRPITGAPDPAAAARAVWHEMTAAAAAARRRLTAQRPAPVR